MTNIKSNQTEHLIIALAAFLACTSVILGAMAAHYLKTILLPERIENMETASKYGIYAFLFCITILFIPILERKTRLRIVQIHLIGAYLFSFSIYALIGMRHLNIDFPSLIALITPVGGTLLIASYLILIYNTLKKYVKK